METHSDQTVRTTLRVLRVHRLGTRKLSRAHLALQRRPAVAQACQSSLAAIAQALGAQLSCPVEATGRLFEFVFDAPRHLSADAAFLVVDFDNAGVSAIVEIEKTVLAAALERLSGGAHRIGPVSRLTRIEEAAFGFLALVGLEAVRGNEFLEKQFAPRLRAVNPTRMEALALVDGSVPFLAAQVVLKVDSVQGQLRIFFPARALQTALHALPEQPAGEVAEEVLAAGISVRTFVGRAVLDATDLRALRTGDVVLFEDVTLAGGQVGGAGRLSATSFELFGQFGPDGFQFTRAIARKFPQESSMSQPVPKTDAPALPVEVEVELTRLRLTLTELASIRANSILPLHINAAEPVILRVGDRAVARAELVEIDGEIGARILTLFS